jgi:hypothetical protein
MEAARYATKYLAHTKNLGIFFTKRKGSILESFLHFPTSPNQVLSISDANWGPPDASRPTVSVELPLFTS